MSDKNFTDSSSNSIKDSDKNINNFSENNSNNINITINKDLIENDEFKSPDHELIWTHFFQSTYHFKQDIERVWMLLKNFELLSLFGNEGQYPCINLKGKDTWKVGNIFKGNLYKIFPFIARVEKSNNLPEMKYITWLFNNINEDDYFEIKMELFKVNEDNSTIALRTIKFQKKEISMEVKNRIFDIIKIFKNIENLLENESIKI